MISSVPNTTPSLYISGGNHCNEEHYWPITQSLLIGREDADITIALPSLSRRHAQVIVHGTTLCTIEDLNSKNGTAVNGVYLRHGPYHLKHGDIIVLAGIIELRYNDPNATPFARKLGSLSGLWIDADSQDVWIDAEKLVPPLSKTQLMLLQLIVDSGGNVVSKDDIVAQLWPDHASEFISNDAVDSLIKRLRRRLCDIEHGDSVLEVVRGRGIRLKTDRKVNTLQVE